ncbi:DUF1654 domain-containing protein [Vreelandella sulfidaeris]|uniref:DUF1654 domain-containing protein n=1 Tax=Vreelandella sulfidaeris TaxID=115553 RepID=A0A455UFF2_9GAMM|nr:hypothetical protein HSBAA_47070 [Halomonas sulfidaeris]
MSKSYEQLVKRVQRAINSPGAQSKHWVEVKRQAEDEPEDWARVISELGTVENVTLTPIDDDAEHVSISWNPEESMS